MDWITEVADEVEQREPPYVVKGGVSPSGHIHVGHLNELLLPYFVAEELRSRGHTVEQYITVDDLDPNVEDADSIVRELERVIDELGIVVNVWRASIAYEHGPHLIQVADAQSHQNEIAAIVEEYQEIDDTFYCFDEKLPWRVEWAAQWATLGVDFEPYGKDHAEGSFESSSRIAREVFDIEPPVDFVYEWFTLDGEAMSSSSGTVVTAEDALHWISPDDIQLLFRRNPQKQRDFNVENIPSMVGSVIKDGPSYNEACRYWLGHESASRNLFSRQSWDMKYFPRVRAAGTWAVEFGEDYTIESIEPTSDIPEVNDLIEYARNGHSDEDVQDYAYDCAQEYGNVGEYFTNVYMHILGQEDGPQVGDLLGAIFGS